MKPLVSLCLPTNGVIEWVFPVLDSIYSQNVDNSLFEIIITDNGKNFEFKKMIREYINSHTNIIYAETEALPFINEIEAYKRANGTLFKFVNHRTKLVEGALAALINFVQKNGDKKPVIYFGSGVLDIEKKQHEYTNFNQFVKNLSFWSSWSTGMAIWKEDFNKLPDDVSKFNELFPHTNILFNERNKELYIIDNSIIFDEIQLGKKTKGNYDLFFAFGIEYPYIICTLLRDKSITTETFCYVIDKNLEFIAGLYLDYCIRKKNCAYDLSGLNNIFGVFYTRTAMLKKIPREILIRIIRKIRRLK